MAMKFKVGDRVRVLASVGGWKHSWRGHLGTVLDYMPDDEADTYPWGVEIKYKGAGRRVSFDARELELAPKTKRAKKRKK